MKFWQFPCSLFFLLALGCGESDQYASYDNTEDPEESLDKQNTESRGARKARMYAKR